MPVDDSDSAIPSGAADALPDDLLLEEVPDGEETRLRPEREVLPVRGPADGGRPVSLVLVHVLLGHFRVVEIPSDEDLVRDGRGEAVVSAPVDRVEILNRKTGGECWGLWPSRGGGGNTYGIRS